MDHEDYRQRCIELSEAFEAGDFDRAEAGWHDLLRLPELPVIDRVVLGHNLALTVSADGRDAEAEAHMDQAIAWERPLLRALARSGKADWLARRGRTAEAVVILEQLAAEPWTSWGERDAFLRRIAALQEQQHPAPGSGRPTGPAPKPEPDLEPQRKRWFGGRS